MEEEEDGAIIATLENMGAAVAEERMVLINICLSLLLLSPFLLFFSRVLILRTHQIDLKSNPLHVCRLLLALRRNQNVGICAALGSKLFT